MVQQWTNPTLLQEQAYRLGLAPWIIWSTKGKARWPPALLVTPEVSYLVEVDWNNDGYADQAYDNITSDVLNIQTIRGRDFPAPSVGLAVAGSLTAVLKNQNGKYNARNGASPLTGNLKPGRQIRLSAGMKAQGQAASFDAASSQYFSMTDASASWTGVGNNNLDIIMWVKLRSLPTAGNKMGLIGRWQAANMEYSLYVDNTAGTIRFKFQKRTADNLTTQTVTASTFGTPAIGTWYMVHAYYDVDLATDQIGISVNDGAHDTVNAVDGMRNGGATFEVGAIDGASFFNGELDEIAFCKITRLTSAQVTWLYNAGAGRDMSECAVAGTDGANMDQPIYGWFSFESSPGELYNSYGISSFLSGTLVNNGGVTFVPGLSTTRMYTLWLGVLDRIEPSVLVKKYPTAILRASGMIAAVAVLNRTDLPTQFQQSMDTLAKSVIEAAPGSGGFSLDLTAPLGSGIISDFQYEQSESLLKTLRDIEATEQGFFYEALHQLTDPRSGISKQGASLRFTRFQNLTGAFELRGYRAASQTVSQGTFSDDEEQLLHYVEIDQMDPIRGILNDVQIPYQLSAISAQVETIIQPSGVGTFAQWTPSSGANWDCVDETPADEDATYVYTPASAIGIVTLTKDSYAFNDISPALPADATTTSVKLTLRLRVPAGVGQPGWIAINPWVKTAGNFYYSGTPIYTATASYQDYSVSWPMSPATGLPWTEAAINAAEFGYESSLIYLETRITQLFVTVGYTTSANVTVLWTYPGAAIVLPHGQSVKLTAQYPGSDVATGMCVYPWTTPVVGTDVTQTGVANSDIAIVVVKRSNELDITITNNHASASATLTLVRARGVAVLKSNLVLVTAFDQTSIDAYGSRPKKLDKAWVKSFDDAQALATYIKTTWKDPRTLLQIRVKARSNVGHMIQALQRALSDRITVEADGTMTYMGINEAFYIEAIAHEISPQGGHVTTFWLSAVSA